MAATLDAPDPYDESIRGYLAVGSCLTNLHLAVFSLRNAAELIAQPLFPISESKLVGRNPDGSEIRETRNYTKEEAAEFKQAQVQRALADLAKGCADVTRSMHASKRYAGPCTMTAETVYPVDHVYEGAGVFAASAFEWVLHAATNFLNLACYLVTDPMPAAIAAHESVPVDLEQRILATLSIQSADSRFCPVPAPWDSFDSGPWRVRLRKEEQAVAKKLSPQLQSAPKASHEAPQESPVNRLLRVRQRFGEVLRNRPQLRQRAEAGYRRYFELCQERRKANRARSRAREKKVRQVLAAGRLRDPDPIQHGWTQMSITGLIPVDLLIAVSAFEAHSCPEDADARNKDRSGPVDWCQSTDLPAKLAAALLDALDWQDRLQRASLKSKAHNKKCWEDWTSRHPKSSHAEATYHLWYRPPPNTEDLLPPGHLTLVGLQALPHPDKVALAWARLAALWDAQTQYPILAAVQPPSKDDFLEHMLWMFNLDTIQPFSKSSPFSESDSSATTPKLDPEKLEPDMAEDCLGVIEADLRAPVRDPLGAKAAAVYEELLALPLHRGLTGPELLDRLGKRKPPVNMDQSTLTTHILPELKPYGVQNKHKVGYYIPADARPSNDAL